MKVKVVILFVVAVIICCGSSFAQTANDHIIEGNQLIAQNKIRDAIGKFNDALKIEPNNYLAFFGNGIAYEKLYKYDTALYYFRKTVNFKKDFEQAYYKSGVVRYKLKSYTQAVHDFDRVLKINPRNYEALYYRANACYKMGFYNGAALDYKALSFKTDTNRYFYLKYCISNLKSYNRSKAIKSFDTLISLFPNYDTAYYYRGILKLDDDKTSSAIDDFTKVLKLNDRYTEAYIMRGRAKQRYDGKSVINDDLNKWKEINPDFVSTELEKAYNLYYDSEYYEAIEHFQNIIAADSNNSQAFFILGNCYKFNENYKLSLINAENAIKLSRDYWDAYLLKAQVYLHYYLNNISSIQIVNNDGNISIVIESADDIADALTLLVNRNHSKYKERFYDSVMNITDLILKNDPMNYSAYLLRGDVLKEKNSLNDALKEYNKAIELSQETQCYFQRALLYIRTKDYQNALNDIEKCYEYDDKSLNARVVKAMIHNMMGDEIKASRELESILDDEIRRNEAYVAKGYYQMLFLENFKGAILDFDKALEIDPYTSNAYLYRSQAKKVLGDKLGSKSDMIKYRMYREY